MEYPPHTNSSKLNIAQKGCDIVVIQPSFNNEITYKVSRFIMERQDQLTSYGESIAFSNWLMRDLFMVCEQYDTKLSSILHICEYDIKDLRSSPKSSYKLTRRLKLIFTEEYSLEVMKVCIT